MMLGEPSKVTKLTECGKTPHFLEPPLPSPQFGFSLTFSVKLFMDWVRLVDSPTQLVCIWILIC